MSEEHDDTVVGDARLGFRDALVRTYRTHGHLDELENAASLYCRALRDRGVSPERALVDAKQVIFEAIDDHDRSVADRAVTMCITNYFRDDERRG